MSTIVTFNTDRCKQDGICGLVCPTKRITSVIGQFPVEEEAKPCLLCGQCVAFCPHEAVQVAGLDMSLAKVIERKNLPTPESVDLVLQSRRSIRQYKEEPVSREMLEAVLATASYAPTAKNERNLRFIVVYEQSAMKKLGDTIAACLLDNAKESDPVIPEGAVLGRAWQMGKDYIFRGAPHLVGCAAPAEWFWKECDSAIALTYIEVAAAARGLGTCWGGYVTVAAMAFQPVRDVLGLDDEEVLGGAQMIGKPRIKQKHIAPRSVYPMAWL